MIKDIDGLLSHVYNEIRKATDVAVVGLSGGADSTLVACLCVGALGKDNVFGIHMPYGDVDTSNFNKKSEAVAHVLGIWDRTISIRGAVDALTEEFESLSELNHGNMRSRMRMVSLYTACCSLGENLGKRVRVMGTGNLSEDLIGYDTKGGDALCDIFPIGELTKSEVYQLLEYFAEQGLIGEEHINRTPSAGLWDGQTDEGELGYTYNEMEPYVVHGHVNGVSTLLTAFPPDDKLARFVHDRYFANKHKHEAPPTIPLRQFCDGVEQ